MTPRQREDISKAQFYFSAELQRLSVEHEDPLVRLAYRTVLNVQRAVINGVISAFLEADDEVE